eukprot:CAMPEP_0204320540 /NCGR_PEP_ID=MMETSP0469-20131031/7692_1 /ASSEMBLY_ACC=CAM_ASM_000384 /TAXON_ID=2969 /ORGANISM="Oxyrrhis marina" /LENGTH=354 /DNA_ID=CAMNT_0051301805 /DNA_START=31 /DNA_END=1092 /DNA_ORIENTATION=-
MSCLCGNGKKICHYKLPSSTKPCRCSVEALEKFCHLPLCLAAKDTELALKNEQRKYAKSTRPRPEQRAVTKVTDLILSWVTQTVTDPEAAVRKHLEQLEGYPAQELRRALSDAQSDAPPRSKVDPAVLRQFAEWLVPTAMTATPSAHSERDSSEETSDESASEAGPGAEAGVETWDLQTEFDFPDNLNDLLEAGAAGGFDGSMAPGAEPWMFEGCPPPFDVPSPFPDGYDAALRAATAPCSPEDAYPRECAQVPPFGGSGPAAPLGLHGVDATSAFYPPFAGTVPQCPSVPFAAAHSVLAPGADPWYGASAPYVSPDLWSLQVMPDQGMGFVPGPYGGMDVGAGQPMYPCWEAW